MHCTAQLFVDAMATRRHIRRHLGTKPVTMADAYVALLVSDHDIERMFLVGATGNIKERILFMDGSEASLSEDSVWTVPKEAIQVGEIPADFPNPSEVGA